MIVDAVKNAAPVIKGSRPLPTLAMLFGPNLILKTSSGTLVNIHSLLTGDNFRSHFSTDGKLEAPMLLDEPWLRRVPRTDELFWTSECEEVGKEELGSSSMTGWLWAKLRGRDAASARNYFGVPFARTPGIGDYRRALTIGIAATPAKERHIRMRYWWAANDPVRRGKAPAPLSPEYHENLLRFRTILDTSEPDQRLMAAEVSRQLRDFSAAAVLLDFPFPKKLTNIVDFIGKLAKAGDATVREVPPSKNPSTELDPEFDNTLDTSEIRDAFQQLGIGVTVRRGRIDRATGRKEIFIVGTGQQLEAASAYCQAQEPPIDILFNKLPS